ncbi:hypothetical protein [Nonomuraea antri]|nr:hypothetical protein [Nonomuraea antri]
MPVSAGPQEGNRRGSGQRLPVVGEGLGEVPDSRHSSPNAINASP